ncbi:MAG: hypothetical protein A2498_00340 [Lentisphaerae bacterium RIFOXYC12_FULL_60_16]|nr:MAG: hypothetical protein A2498_00340 [Lentisphaerae bacterium RIFOXYC12_FULL_60_16]OGV71638.1 MAG: hypothetical protein A2269_08855 [Lentisphaerae bacterium RIFOXYA12_FULL_60_10]OGV85097.1 MAG: hypothetical protein A2340_09625 [Lentisphaerae bacterium RIFOXYB12_FULL_60_10]
MIPPMRSPICWTDRLEDGVKREVRVYFHGVSQILWEFRRSDQDDPDTTTRPTADEWHTLQTIAERWYQRRRLPHEHLERIAACMKAEGLPDSREDSGG